MKFSRFDYKFSGDFSGNFAKFTLNLAEKFALNFQNLTSPRHHMSQDERKMVVS